MWYSILIAVMASYLLGNLNGAVCMSYLLAHEDVRNHGSGNAGLTNFVRNYGALKGLSVLAIDAVKTAVACLLGGLLLKPFDCQLIGMTIGGLSVMTGHAFPALLGFKGGKGILSGLFVAVVADWRIALIILAIFALVYATTKYVSLASILASAGFSACFAIFHHDNLYVMIGGIVMGCLTIFMHRGNILRLMKGQEQKTNLFGKGKQK